MSPKGRFTAFAAIVVAMLIQLSGAKAETVSIETSMKPFGGKLFKEVRVPVQSRLKVQVEVPPGQQTILPLKRTRIRFDTDMTYNPDNRKTPPCPDSKLSQTSSLGLGVAAIVDLCPRSVIGTGTSLIYLVKSTASPLADPQLVIFNAGRDARGNPKMKIYGFSKATGTGLLMEGSLNKNGIQDVPIGVLSYDSAVGNFVFDMPGTGMKVEDAAAPGGFRVVKGLDRGYVRARCSDGMWSTGGDFYLGERNASTGADIGPTTIVPGNVYNDSCRGLKGRPKLRRKAQRGPRAARRGARVRYRVTVANRGTATARAVKLRVRGGVRGSARGGKIAPGKRKTFTVRGRVVARKGARARVRIQVIAKGARVVFGRAIRVR